MVSLETVYRQGADDILRVDEYRGVGETGGWRSLRTARRFVRLKDTQTRFVVFISENCGVEAKLHFWDACVFVSQNNTLQIV